MSLYTPKYKEQDSKGGGFVELIDVTDSKLMYLSIGLLPQKVNVIKRLGMEVIPRTASYKTWNSKRYAEAVIAGYEKYGIRPAYLIVGGESLPGYDDGIQAFKEYTDANGIKIGLIEDTTQLQNILQLGVLELAESNGYNAVRVFSVWNYIQYRYQYYGYEGAKEIENTLFRAIVERNVRVVYYKPIREIKDLHTYVTDVDEYRELFANLEKRLAGHGLRQGEASAMSPYEVPFAMKLVIGFGSVAAALLLLQLVMPLPGRARFILLALGVLCVPASFYVMPNTTELIVSLVNALVFGCLATVYFTRAAKARFDGAGLTKDPPGAAAVLKGATATLLASVAIALAGAAVTAAPLSSVSYMLEIDIFRGVKVSQLLPIAFFVVVYMAYFGFGAGKRQMGRLEFSDVKELMNTSIKVWMILLGALFAAGGAYYILRTGHEVITVSRVEMILRNDLEEMLIARPRTKEFLFAFPAVMLMAYTACRRLRFWTVVFGICGVVGVTSVINTFMHIRTPLYLGFARTGFSIAFGIVAGAAYILVFHFAYKAYKKLERRYSDA
jgi:hypothetical protein